MPEKNTATPEAPEQLGLAKELLVAHKLGLDGDYLMLRVVPKIGRDKRKEEDEIRLFYNRLKDPSVGSIVYLMDKSADVEKSKRKFVNK